MTAYDNCGNPIDIVAWENNIRKNAILKYENLILKKLVKMKEQYEADKENVPKPNMKSFVALLSVCENELLEEENNNE